MKKAVKKSPDTKYVKIVKTLAITAFVCTVVLFLFLVTESALPSNISSGFTGSVTEIVDSIFSVSEKIEETYETQSLTITGEKPSYGYFHVGETFQIIIKYYPENTHDKEVSYSVDDPSLASVSEDGVVTFLNKGTVEVTATLKSNSAVYTEKSFWCVGEDVLDETHPERKTLSLKGYDGNEAIEAGDSATILLNDGKTFAEITSLSIKDGDIAIVNKRTLYALKAGQTEIYATITRGDVSVVLTLPITVSGEDYTVINEIVCQSEVSITDGDKINDYHSLFEIEEGRDLSEYDCKVKSSDSAIINVVDEHLMAKGQGVVTLTCQSIMNPEIVATIEINVLPVAPTDLTIVGDDRVVPRGVYTYSAYHAPKKYEDAVTWTIVKGNAEISENGKLTVNFFGTIIIRCQSTVDENLYAEKTIKVGFFTDAKMVVRKIMGHMGLHMLLGLGITACIVLLSKRKLLCFFTPLICVFPPILTEFIQYFTPGRVCAVTDMVTDYFGSLMGMGVFAIIFSAILIIWRLINKKSFSKLFTVIKTVNITNVFKKTSYVESIAFTEDSRS